VPPNQTKECLWEPFSKVSVIGIVAKLGELVRDSAADTAFQPGVGHRGIPVLVRADDLGVLRPHRKLTSSGGIDSDCSDMTSVAISVRGSFNLRERNLVPRHESSTSAFRIRLVLNRGPVVGVHLLGLAALLAAYVSSAPEPRSRSAWCAIF
jgi:hypothetical protein